MMNKTILLMCMLLPACGKQPTPKTETNSAPQEEWVQGIGYVEPAHELRRLAFKYPGVIKECCAEAGQNVKQGQLLMRLGDREERAAIAEVEALLKLTQALLAQTLVGVNPARTRAQKALLEGAVAEAAHAKKEFERRHSPLLSDGATSQTDRDQMEMLMNQKAALVRQAQAELEHLGNFVQAEDRSVMEAKVKQAEAQLEVARSRAAEMELHAPCDGTVLEVLQREGNAVHSAFPEPVIVFADLTRLRVRAEIDETYALRLKQGQVAVIRTRDEGKTEIAGTISFVKQVMGKKTVFSKTATERKDLDVLQVLIDLPAGLKLPIGLEVDLRVKTAVR